MKMLRSTEAKKPLAGKNDHKDWSLVHYKADVLYSYRYQATKIDRRKVKVTMLKSKVFFSKQVF